jgi:hypothetical protein
VVTRPQDGDNNQSKVCDIGAYEISQWVRNTAIGMTATGDSGTGQRLTYTVELTNTGGDASAKNIHPCGLPGIMGLHSGQW